MQGAQPLTLAQRPVPALVPPFTDNGALASGLAAGAWPTGLAARAVASGLAAWALQSHGIASSGNQAGLFKLAAFG